MGFAVAASSRIVCVVMNTIALPAKVNLEANSRAALAAGAGHVREKNARIRRSQSRSRGPRAGCRNISLARRKTLW